MNYHACVYFFYILHLIGENKSNNHERINLNYLDKRIEIGHIIAQLHLG